MQAGRINYSLIAYRFKHSKESGSSPNVQTFSQTAHGSGVGPMKSCVCQKGLTLPTSSIIFA